MPVTEIREINEHTFMGFWHVTETVSVLVEHLKTQRPTKEIPAYKSEVRQKEWLASRILAYQLLENFTAEKFVLHSDENGKPLFPGTAFHVSISQSAGMVVVLVSDRFELGIDIEMLKGKALRLAFKFLSDRELTYIQNDENLACLYWSAKETLYKLYSRKKLLFKENLALGPVNQTPEQTLTGQVLTDNFARTYTVHYEQTEHFILTYCLALPQEIA